MDALPASSSGSTLNPSVRTWTVLCHASAFLGFLIPALGQFVGPLIVWLWKRGESPEIDAHGKESLNFQLSLLIYTAVFAIVCFVLMFVLIGFLLIPLIALFYIANVVLVIIASLRANEGELNRYPLTLRLIK
jgi:hypothetical protein